MKSMAVTMKMPPSACSSNIYPRRSWRRPALSHWPWLLRLTTRVPTITCGSFSNKSQARRMPGDLPTTHIDIHSSCATSLMSPCVVVLIESQIRFRPIPYDQYISGVHTPIYQQGFLLLEDQSQVLTSPRLAVFFTLLAIGSLLSPSLPRKNVEAERLHQLGRAALMRSRLVEDPTIEGIQALFLMTLYMSLYDTAAANTSNIRWSMSG
jgi:hypothetical protein